MVSLSMKKIENVVLVMKIFPIVSIVQQTPCVTSALTTMVLILKVDVLPVRLWFQDVILVISIQNVLVVMANGTLLLNLKRVAVSVLLITITILPPDIVRHAARLLTTVSHARVIRFVLIV